MSNGSIHRQRNVVLARILITGIRVDALRYGTLVVSLYHVSTCLYLQSVQRQTNSFALGLGYGMHAICEVFIGHVSLALENEVEGTLLGGRKSIFPY